MMEKIHIQNIIKSYFLGILIGIVLQFNDIELTGSDRILIILSSGMMGLSIGFVTEWITSKIPISLAKPLNYFLINNMIALIVTTCIMLFALATIRSELNNISEFLPILGIVLVIVFVANLGDYILFLRAQNKLKIYKGKLKEKVSK
jgi:FtsH-binding integral membrane protein